ncbi:MAG: DNA repair protein RecO [Planctomycetes bacterium]|nr:DNA repair protein RecO [Planctomycetota bacterium]
MPAIRDDAVVLGRLDYSETSQILVLFTRAHGKVRAIAKGIKRGTKTRFASGVDMLDVGHAVLSSRRERSEALAILTEWKQSRSFSGLREKLFRIRGAQYVGEITSGLTEEWDPHEQLYDALVDALGHLSEASSAVASVVSYQMALLKAIGALPRFDACVLCGGTDALTYFSSFEGGLICRNCESGQVEKREVGPMTLAALRGSPVAGSPSGAFSALNYHLAHLMGREPKLADEVVARVAQRRIE